MKIKKLAHKIQVVRAPRYRLSTFGESKIHYQLVTDVSSLADRSRLRTGVVVAEQPALITPDSLRDRFLGFGKGAKEYADWLLGQYGQALKGLAYQFRNKQESSRIELHAPDVMVKKLTDRFDHGIESRVAILRGADKIWQLSIMKFIVEETLASFASNVQELKERGFLEGEDRHESRRHREIQNLLKRAALNPELVPVLAKKLKDYGLFEDYQDQFFRLVH